MTKHVLSYKFTAKFEGTVPFEQLNGASVEAAKAQVATVQAKIIESGGVITRAAPVKARTVRE